jgi:hypothetical protein
MWVFRYEKKGCKAQKEIDLPTIAANGKFEVPQDVIDKYIGNTHGPADALKQKVTGAKPWDVRIEEDHDAGEFRLILTHIAPAPIIIKWHDTQIKARLQNIAKVKSQVAQWKSTNDKFLQDIEAVKNEIKLKLKPRIEKVEKEAAQSGLVQMIKAEIDAITADLKKASQAGAKIYSDHKTWYAKPREGGIAPVLKTHHLEMKDLTKPDQDVFAKSVMDISENAGKVLHVYKTDVEAAANTLTIRLQNLGSQVTKDTAQALHDISQRLHAELERLQKYTGDVLKEIKYDVVLDIAQQFKLKKGQRYDTLTQNAIALTGQIGANDNKLSIVANSVSHFEKEHRRLYKAVPPIFAKQTEVTKMLNYLDSLHKNHNKTMGEVTANIQECTQLLKAHK